MDYRESIRKFEDQFQKIPNGYEHFYRVFKTQWGIRIRIFAEYKPMSNYEDKESCTEICPGLWAVYSSHLSKKICIGLNESEKNFLWEGLKKTCQLIKCNSSYKSDTLIVIHYIWFNECDYQEEGLTAAIMEWAANAFDFEAPQIDVSYNKESNRYEFSYK